MSSGTFSECPEVGEVILSQERIQQRVRDLASEVSQRYFGKDLVIVGILKGAFIFLADIVRYMTCPHRIDFMAVSSYGTSTSSSGVVRILKDLDESIEGKHVLIVEDIIDTGLTLNYLCETLQARKPASLGVCALLNKPSRRIVDVTVDFVGFDIPDVFVVGYGLDFEERFRNLPEIRALNSTQRWK